MDIQKTNINNIRLPLSIDIQRQNVQTLDHRETSENLEITKNTQSSENTEMDIEASTTSIEASEN